MKITVYTDLLIGSVRRRVGFRYMLGHQDVRVHGHTGARVILVSSIWSICAFWEKIIAG